MPRLCTCDDYLRHLVFVARRCFYKTKIRAKINEHLKSMKIYFVETVDIRNTFVLAKRHILTK
jgi:hypothetical protein